MNKKKQRFFAGLFTILLTLSLPMNALASTPTYVPIIPWDYFEQNSHPMLSGHPVISLPVMTEDEEYIQLTYREQLQFEEAYTAPNVELLEWSYVRTFLTLHEHIQVYDVLTGLTYYVYSFSNGRHADVRTVSRADTDILFHTFGYQWGWNVRPVWVTIGDRVIAASINGQPHGGNGNPANGLGGHVCLHFFGSSTHNGNLNFARLHQDVLHKAYRLSQGQE